MQINNSELKYLRSLGQKKVRDVEKKFILEGWRSLSEAIDSDFPIEYIAITNEAGEKSVNRSLLKTIRQKQIPIKEIKANQLEKISSTIHSQGVIALLRQKEIKLDEYKIKNSKLIIACDRISDPGNLGTIIRICDWFKADIILLSKGSVSLFNEKVIRSTAGSIFHCNVIENVNILEMISLFKRQGYRIIATALNGTSLYEAELPERMLLLLGNEGEGLAKEILEHSDEIFSIPRFGKAESLNVGIACSIFLFNYRKIFNK